MASKSFTGRETWGLELREGTWHSIHHQGSPSLSSEQILHAMFEAKHWETNSSPEWLVIRGGGGGAEWLWSTRPVWQGPCLSGWMTRSSSPAAWAFHPQAGYFTSASCTSLNAPSCHQGFQVAISSLVGETITSSFTLLFI